MRTLLLLSFFCFLGLVTRAQDDVFSEDSLVSPAPESTLLVEPSELETTKAYLKEEVKKRPFNEEDWNEVVDGANYTEKALELEPSTRKPISWSWNSTLVSIISYGIVGIIVLTILYFILKNISFDRKEKVLHEQQPDPDQPVDDIESLDTQKLLAAAIRDGNFKLAVRLYYLSMLKLLNEKGFISWKKDKTNRDYLGELFSRDFFYDDIRGLTYSYESVWYGDHDVRRENFDGLSAQFEKVMTNINDSGK